MAEILYIEYWDKTKNEKVEKVTYGMYLETRVVFKADSPGNYKICLQRTPGGQRVCTGVVHLDEGTYYWAFTWKVDYTGEYKIVTELYKDDVLADTKEFPHIVEGAPPAPTPPPPAPTPPPTAPPTAPPTPPPTAPPTAPSINLALVIGLIAVVAIVIGLLLLYSKRKE